MMHFTDGPPPNGTRQHVYNVSELNLEIKHILEDKYPFIWISGEISNFRTPSSGHCYFTLKDSHSQISAVLFRTQANALSFTPEDGIAIVGLGRISVYEPRGAYQVIFEYIEPKGIGALLIAFEKRKRKLAAEGLFDARHKLALPPLPHKISVVSSPTGAAVRDFIHIAHRRWPNLWIEIAPVSVQGQRAPAEIVAAINALNDRRQTDVIVLARGGGSIEDLNAFNDEQVVRTIFASTIPVVSAVGHETDYTLADFVADLRAPTPSAAAELCVPSKDDLQKQILQVNVKLFTTINNILKNLNTKIEHLRQRIVHPRRRIEDWRVRLDDLAQRLTTIARELLRRRRERLAFHMSMLMQVSPAKRLKLLKGDVGTHQDTLSRIMLQRIADQRSRSDRQRSIIDALNPMAILQRGYSITRTVPEHSIVHSARQVDVDQHLEVLLGSGQLSVTVRSRRTEPPP